MSGIDGEEQERGEQDEVDTTLQSGGPARYHGEDADHNRQREQQHLGGTQAEQRFEVLALMRGADLAGLRYRPQLFASDF
jgi:hypothetical protein